MEELKTLELILGGLSVTGLTLGFKSIINYSRTRSELMRKERIVDERYASQYAIYLILKSDQSVMSRILNFGTVKAAEEYLDSQNF